MGDQVQEEQRTAVHARPGTFGRILMRRRDGKVSVIAVLKNGGVKLRRTHRGSSKRFNHTIPCPKAQGVQAGFSKLPLSDLTC